MSKNKRVPKVLQKYVVIGKTVGGFKAQYFITQKEARDWAKSQAPSVYDLFRINYDFYETLNGPKKRVSR